MIHSRDVVKSHATEDVVEVVGRVEDAHEGENVRGAVTLVQPETLESGVNMTSL